MMTCLGFSTQSVAKVYVRVDRYLGRKVVQHYSAAACMPSILGRSWKASFWRVFLARVVSKTLGRPRH